MNHIMVAASVLLKVQYTEVAISAFFEKLCRSIIDQKAKE